MRRLILLFSFFACLCLSISAQSVTGTWYGLLDMKVVKLRLVVHIQELEGKYTATMDSPDQGAKGIPVTQVKYDNDLLTIHVQPLNLMYSGVVKGDSIVGTFAQRGQGAPLTLTREEVKRARPQTPKPPFRYQSEDITFHNSQGGINLAGTFTYPTLGDNFPVVVLISGSGAQNRDEEILEHKPFAVIADYLTRHGIAVLRFDDRGVGDSEGNFSSATTEDFATDVMAAIQYLKTRKEIDSENIGLIGHSEGGLISFMLASRYPDDISFIVSLAGMAVDANTLLKKQRQLLAEAQGLPKELQKQNEEILNKVQTLVETLPADSIKRNLVEVTKSILPEQLRYNDKIVHEVAMQIGMMISPWMQYLLQYNPEEEIKKISCPVLALNGEKDLQVDGKQNIDKLKKLLSKNKDLATKIYPNLNHLFQHCQTGLPTEYDLIEETISSEVLYDIVSWISEYVKKEIK